MRNVEAGGEERGWEGFSGFFITKMTGFLVRYLERVCGWFEALNQELFL